MDLSELSPVPEHPCCLQVTGHPLWRTALQVATRADAPEWFIQEAVVDQRDLRCASSCLIVITNGNRMLFQHRREGRQGFGGGKSTHALVNKAHSARRELFWEANLDLNSTAVLFITSPFLTTCGNQGPRNWWGSCWIQIVVLDDSEVRTDLRGVVWVADTQLWSRELAWVRDCHNRHPQVSTIHRGQFYQDQPVFGIMGLGLDDWSTFRRVDRVSLTLLQREILAAQHLRRRPPTAYFNWTSSGLTLAEEVAYEHLCDHTMRLWAEHFGGVASERWFLIATPVLYATLVVPQWRESARQEARAKKRPRMHEL